MYVTILNRNIYESTYIDNIKPQWGQDHDIHTHVKIY